MADGNAAGLLTKWYDTFFGENVRKDAPDKGPLRPLPSSDARFLGQCTGFAGLLGMLAGGRTGWRDAPAIAKEYKVPMPNAAAFAFARGAATQGFKLALITGTIVATQLALGHGNPARGFDGFSPDMLVPGAVGIGLYEVLSGHGAKAVARGAALGSVAVAACTVGYGLLRNAAPEEAHELMVREEEAHEALRAQREEELREQERKREEARAAPTHADADPQGAAGTKDMEGLIAGMAARARELETMASTVAAESEAKSAK